MTDPAWPGYLADPYVLRDGDDYFAFGTGGAAGDRVFEVITSADLRSWRSLGGSLERLPADAGDEYWAPEVVEDDGRFWMYYSVGHGIAGHHIRVATSAHPSGPYTDLGLNLTPHESFAIDPHAFRDADGAWYLYFARDVLEHDRPGTHLAVQRLEGMTALVGDPTVVLSPNADWQLYARERQMYGRVFDWHTLEGPTVVLRNGRYWITFSGGSWEGEGYGVSWGVADSPLGPWSHATAGARRLLETGDEFIGPGHSSITTAPDGGDVIVFHAWTSDRSRRVMHLRRIEFGSDSPRLTGHV